MKYYLFVVLLFVSISLAGQNLVPNPSFETISGCPDNFFQIYKAPPWFSPDCGSYFPDHGYAVLFNGCNSSFASVPANSVCTQYARTGVGYAGIEVMSVIGTNYHTYRQYLETKLTAPLISGKKYYFSMYFNFCDRFPGAALCFNADSLGVKFSGDKIDKNPDCNILPFRPDIHSTLAPVIPGSKWHKVDGCFTASGGENFITIGNYAGEKASNCSSIDTLAYFIFVDDVSLISEIDKKTDTTLCTGSSWELDAAELRNEYKTVDGWSFKWNDGDSSRKRIFTKSTRDKLTVSLNGCFFDQYDFNITVDENCDCQIFAPNAFTPDGDGLNDFFLPHIKCKSVQPFNYTLSIYNRFGEKIFFTQDKTKGWDGKYKNVTRGSETFLWVIQYDINDASSTSHKTISGTVTPLR